MGWKKAWKIRQNILMEYKLFSCCGTHNPNPNSPTIHVIIVWLLNCVYVCFYQVNLESARPIFLCVCAFVFGPSWSPPATSDEAVETCRSILPWFIAVGSSIAHTATELGQTLGQIYTQHFFRMELTSLPAGLTPSECVCVFVYVHVSVCILLLFNLIYY